MSQYAIMPLSDYKSTCDVLREKTGSTGTIKSGELPDKISEVYEKGKEAGGGADLSNFIDVSGKWLFITFTIDGYVCKAEEGQTWYEWLKTDYKDAVPERIHCDTEDSIVTAETGDVMYEGGELKGSDTIIADAQYFIG